MPVIIPQELPAYQTLKDHGLFVMNPGRAETQDIRPLRLCILNLMPDKITTETQILSKLSNSVVQVEITLLAIENHTSKNTKQTHLDSFYSHFSQIKDQYFDGIIITGAPIEHLHFKDVTYWTELKEILDWTTDHVFRSLFICWGAQAALYHFYGIEKESFSEKLFGVYSHTVEDPTSQLFVGMNETFHAPHSRNTQSKPDQITAEPTLQVLARSKEAGIHLTATKDHRQLFMSGHPEYDTKTLEQEYLRDLEKGFMELPKNYYAGNHPAGNILTSWKSDASMFYLNWLNYYVYQETDYLLGASTFQKTAK